MTRIPDFTRIDLPDTDLPVGNPAGVSTNTLPSQMTPEGISLPGLPARDQANRQPVIDGLPGIAGTRLLRVALLRERIGATHSRCCASRGEALM